jgi:hypothetical protein
MRLKPAQAVRMLMVAAVTAMSVVLVVSGPRLRAQQRPNEGKPISGGDVPKSESLPTPVFDPGFATPSEALPAPAMPPTAPPRVLPSPSSTAAGTMADPEAAAFGFVERTTKEADDAIKALAKEAETLRARLQKVEAGLTRWQAVKTSLEAHCERATWKARTPADGPVSEDEQAAARSRTLRPLPELSESPLVLPPTRPAKLKPTQFDAVAPPPVAPAPSPAPKPSEPVQKK